MAKAIRAIPYKLPLQQDFRTLPRLPDSWKVGMGRNRGALFARAWGVRLHWPHVDAAAGLAESHRRTYPYSQNERVRWAEPVRAIDIPPQAQPPEAGQLSATPQAWELVRQAVPVFGTFILEKIATYIRAQPLNAAGAPIGGPTITNILTDPFLANPIPHPTAGVGGLQFGWALVQDQLPVERRAESLPPNVLNGAPINAIPSGYPIPGLPPDWADLRYAWGQPYTWKHHILLSGGNSLLRLFVTLSSASPDRWSVRPGGMLSGWWQSAGRLGAALNAAVRRYP